MTQSTGVTTERKTASNPPPQCGHNSWDNVRVIKGQVTLRCRVCQVQWRTHVDAVWRKKKCGFFNTAEGCSLGASCPKLHLHTRKQSLAERFENHGAGVLEQVPAEAIPEAVAVFKNDEETITNSTTSPVVTPKANQRSPKNNTTTSTQSEVAPVTKIHSTRPCAHNSWDNVRVKKGLVTLRCRVCQSQWRRVLEDLPRCTAFPNCSKGADCEFLHLHAYKQSLAQRRGLHGEAILQRVPPFVWSAPAEPKVTKAQEPAIKQEQTSTSQWVHSEDNTYDDYSMNRSSSVSTVDAPSVELSCNNAPVYWPQQPISEGVTAWFDSPYTYTSIPHHLSDATLLQGAFGNVQQGTAFQVKVNTRSTVYMIHQGTFTASLLNNGWLPLEVHGPMVTTPHSATPTLVHYASVEAGATLEIPATVVSNDVFSIAVRAAKLPSMCVSQDSSACVSGQTSLAADEELQELIDLDLESSQDTFTTSSDDAGRRHVLTPIEFTPYDMGGAGFQRCMSCPPPALEQ